MQKKTLLTAAITLASTQGLLYTSSAQADSPMVLLDQAKPIANLNLRYESNDTDDATGNSPAKAITLRSRLGVQFGDYQGLTGLFEIEDVQAFRDAYAPESKGFDVVADPENTEFNRAQLQYSRDGFSAIVGRQRIILDNARFVGNVGWRQNEQTFDAVKLGYKTDTLNIQYAYVDQVNGILRTFDADTSHHLTNIAYTGLPVGTITAYSYLLEDDDDSGHAVKNADTRGISLKGKQKLNDLTLHYKAEYAAQSAKKFDASYTHLELGLTLSGVSLFVGNETLGSDDGNYGFQTPLATKHAFNGWADQFLATPTVGLSDTYLKAVTKVEGIKLLAMYHTYKADEGSTDYGDEMNFLAAKKLNKHLSTGIKVARYTQGDADSKKVDTNKMWLWLSAKL
ncbi:MAG: alginate export family protein [Oceanobacter sp.]